MRSNPASAPDAAPDLAPSWRRETLLSMLGVAAIVAPAASVFGVAGLPSPRPLGDVLVILAAGAVMPLLRLVPIFSYAVRAAVTMAVLFGAGVFVLSRSGLSPGAALLFAVSSLFGAMYFGRAVGYATIAVGGAAFAVVGWLVTAGHLAPPAHVFSADRFANWLRVGVVFALLTTMLTSGVAFVISRVEAGARDLRVAYERLGRLHLSLESAKEEERRFLAHELHDEFGQLLTALKLRIQLGARGGPAPADGPDPIAVIDDLIARVRRMSGDLRPPLLDEVGLVPALRAYLDMQATLSGVAMSLEVSEPPEGAPVAGRDVEITCFRIVQEAVTNAVRHASPRGLRVRLERGRERLALVVTDDGRGFDVGARLEGAAAAGHLGVIGMRERVRA
ncbi:MAG TPA: sensor histidine kinase, partial [Polyangia bacterium]|nr:sensor histidine kinase [Polyangia bacterium]